MDSASNFTLNIERCINDKSQPAVIRQLFMQLRDDGYINTGKYFAELSTIDLQTLSDLADCTHPDAVDELPVEQIDEGFEAMTLVGMALMVGEGGMLSEESCEAALKLAISYTAIETLYRNGLVNVFRENWTMAEDTGKPIVELRK
jgi:hypothetical protein